MPQLLAMPPFPVSMHVVFLCLFRAPVLLEGLLLEHLIGKPRTQNPPLLWALATMFISPRGCVSLVKN